MMKAAKGHTMKAAMGHTTIAVLPKVIYGTAFLGNLFHEPSKEVKLEVVREVFASGVTMFDSAGTYGAGLALEELGRCLQELDIPPDSVVISNKLAWNRAPLTTTEPTFEVGAWANLEYDAVQDISYQGMMDCYEQGNELRSLSS